MFKAAKETVTLYARGSKLLYKEYQQCMSINQKIKGHGYKPTGEEQRLMYRNARDSSKLVPFFLLAVFLPELLLIVGPKLIPSTCISPAQILKYHQEASAKHIAQANYCRLEMGDIKVSINLLLV